MDRVERELWMTLRRSLLMAAEAIKKFVTVKYDSVHASVTSIKLEEESEDAR